MGGGREKYLGQAGTCNEVTAGLAQTRGWAFRPRFGRPHLALLCAVVAGSSLLSSTSGQPVPTSWCLGVIVLLRWSSFVG